MKLGDTHDPALEELRVPHGPENKYGVPRIRILEHLEIYRKPLPQRNGIIAKNVTFN